VNAGGVCEQFTVAGAVTGMPAAVGAESMGWARLAVGAETRLAEIKLIAIAVCVAWLTIRREGLNLAILVSSVCGASRHCPL
jgi:hypothetical protein